jgi:hypothetical protein
MNNFRSTNEKLWMSQSPEEYNLPKETQEETENLNYTTSIKEIENFIPSFPKSKTSWMDGFTGDFY